MEIWCESRYTADYRLQITMQLSLDFGGSTIDAVTWDGDKILKIESFESGSRYPVHSIYDKIYVTGGKSGFLEGDFVKVPEISAIGAGGWWLSQSPEASHQKLLVVSMGTGTCMVVARKKSQVASFKLQTTHIGGTGIGGGTFLGLGRELLGIKTISELLEIGSRGSSASVDLSVKDIVGEGIGRVSADATASNLGKLAREIKFSKEDLAAGIINLIGQTIGSAVAFAAKSEGVTRVVLVGKLTRAKAVTEVVESILKSFDLEVFVPDKADVAVAIGARIAYDFSVR